MKNTLFLIALSQYQRGFEVIERLEKKDFATREALRDEKARLKDEYMLCYTGFYWFEWRSFWALPRRLQLEEKTA